MVLTFINKLDFDFIGKLDQRPWPLLWPDQHGTATASFLHVWFLNF